MIRKIIFILLIVAGVFLPSCWSTKNAIEIPFHSKLFDKRTLVVEKKIKANYYYRNLQRLNYVKSRRKVDSLGSIYIDVYNNDYLPPKLLNDVESY